MNDIERTIGGPVDTATVHTNVSCKVAKFCALARRLSADNIDAVKAYVSRYPAEDQVLFLVLLMQMRSSEDKAPICRSKAWEDWFRNPEVVDVIIAEENHEAP